MTDDRDTLLDGKRTHLGVGDTKTDPFTDLVGQIVGGYLVQEKIGAGAMGSVYKASHVETNQVVAIKALHPQHVHEPTLVARFRREAMLAARLQHDNVAGVIALGEAIPDGRHLMVLAFADGEPLSDVMTMPLPPERVIALTRQILLGLEHAHGQGLIHRDLKPDNIMVSWRDGVEHVQIVDFGIAVLRSDDTLERLTATGQMIGTPVYMSPEQAKAESFDHRTDLFSLGVIVYEMLSGKLPFEGTAIEIAIANINRDPPSFAERAPKTITDPWLESFARKLMARDVDKRFATARAALDVLDMDVGLALATISLPKLP